jgi:hypothetical protein
VLYAISFICKSVIAFYKTFSPVDAIETSASATFAAADAPIGRTGFWFLADYGLVTA